MRIEGQSANLATTALQSAPRHVVSPLTLRPLTLLCSTQTVDPNLNDNGRRPLSSLNVIGSMARGADADEDDNGDGDLDDTLRKILVPQASSVATSVSDADSGFGVIFHCFSS